MDTHDHRERRRLRDRREFLAGAVAGATGLGLVAASPGPAVAVPAVPVPIIDTHVHFYDPTRPEGVPWPGKGDEVLYRAVLPDEWEKLVAPHGPAGAIVVEASSWVEDNQWLLDLADRHAATRLPGMLGVVGVVGNLPLGTDGCRGLIDRFAKHRLYRGVRVNGDTLLDGLAQDRYASDLVRLADHDLVVDINGGKVFDAADRVAQRLPSLRVVVNHLGNTRIAAEGPLPQWRDAIRMAARRPNVFMKVSALAENAAHSMKVPRAPVDPGFYEPWLAASWEAFGDGRLMYGSNWPVSDRAAGYAELFGIVAPFVRGRGAEAERAFYSGASREAYRWG